MIYSSKLAFINGFVVKNDWRNFKKLWKMYEKKIDLIIYQPMLRSLLKMLGWVIDPLYAKVSYCRYFNTEYSNIDGFPVQGYRID